MTALLFALDEPSPTGLDDLGGEWDTRVRDALATTIADRAVWDSVVVELSRDQAWILLSWAEGACSWAVRSRAPELVVSVCVALAILDGKLDRRDLLVVATLARRAADRLDVALDDLLRDECDPRGEPLPKWIGSASDELPPTHVESGSGESFEYRRKPAEFDPTALEALLRDNPQ